MRWRARGGRRAAREVALAARVLDIEPQSVQREAVPVGVGVDGGRLHDIVHCIVHCITVHYIVHCIVHYIVHYIMHYIVIT